MADPFESSRRKLERAKKHISDLKSEMIVFSEERPHEKIIEEDSEPGYKVHKCRLHKKVPDSFAVIIGDAVTNLRAAMDHAVYACALCNGHTNPRFGTCRFPFANDSSNFEKAVNGCTSVPREIRTLLAGFNAYKGGNDALWGLNNVCNRDKHALITPVLIGNENVIVTMRTGDMESPKNPFWNNAKDEIELFRTKTENPDYDYAVSVYITFDRPEPFAAKAIVGILDDLCGVIEGILMTIEAETRRLGYIL
jgi:hypothetical protein